METSTVYWRGDLKPKVLEQIPPLSANSRQGVAAIFATWGRKRLPLMGGIYIRVAQLPGKRAAGAGSKHMGSH